MLKLWLAGGGFKTTRNFVVCRHDRSGLSEGPAGFRAQRLGTDAKHGLGDHDDYHRAEI